jgi:N4-(beta-N-acetylglucosaminyl)-L-asparaginase
MKAISSANGLEATRLAYARMQAGEDTLDAAIAGVSLVEDDPEDLTVGYGGLPNESGIVELDAAVMHGPTYRAGAVAALQRVRHAARLARLVMEQTDHVLLVGAGALEFARAQGFPEEDLLTEKARKIWLYWKQTHSNQDDWLPPPVHELDPAVRKFFKLDEAAPGGNRDRRLPLSEADRPTGTIHCACINGRGEMSCTTTTSGLAFKLPGRVGDSPIIGAGLYVDNEVGSCGSTGRGEANLENVSSYAGVELMRQGASPVEAGLEVLRRVARRTRQATLLDAEGRPNFNLKFYLLSRQGAHAGVSMWGPAQFAVSDAEGTRLEECAFLYRREE